jgi:hypothetical protein
MTNKCAVCDNDKVTEHPKVKDSFYGLQYLCDDDERGCWDSYDGWYCDTCQLLHDHDTTMESDNSCIKTETLQERADRTNPYLLKTGENK